MTRTINEPESLTLGTTLPPGDPHGVSVSLPKWADTVGWASREPRVLEAMKTGYPRFFVPRVVDKLATQLLERLQTALGLGTDYTSSTMRVMLLDSTRHARMCQKVLPEWNLQREHTGPVDIGAHIVTWEGEMTAVQQQQNATGEPRRTRNIGEEDIVLLTFPADLALEAKAFWQHTGFGISSRRATFWLDNAPFLTSPRIPRTPVSPAERENQVCHARAALKTRIAAGQSSGADNLNVTPSDVFLCPTGMTAIAETAAAIMTLRQGNPSSPYRVAVFGFLYVDTHKVLSRVLGYEPTQYHSTASSLDALEEYLETNRIDVLVTEFPGNPLLQSPDLTHLRDLSRRPDRGFVLVVDDTVGTHANLALLPHCDVVCTSLTKMYCGACNAMGGTVTLSPHSAYHERLAGALERRQHEAESSWFWEDMLVVEMNGRDFCDRVHRAGKNAEVVVAMLRRSDAVAEVYYPLGGPTQKRYDQFRRKGGGYGYLVSIKFRRPAQAVAFYDALDVAKGPSLGTNFTLCCAYTLLAHYKELDWAGEYGVVEHLVRISVGLENKEWLEERVQKALEVTESIKIDTE
ncbi:putative cystathionine gamma-synthase/beta-lyase [Corynascus similis CBS 632.67]